MVYYGRKFNTTSTMVLELKLLDLSHTTAIVVICHLTDKLLNNDLILLKEKLHDLGIVLNFDNTTITW